MWDRGGWRKDGGVETQRRVNWGRTGVVPLGGNIGCVDWSDYADPFVFLLFIREVAICPEI